MRDAGAIQCRVMLGRGFSFGAASCSEPRYARGLWDPCDHLISSLPAGGACPWGTSSLYCRQPCQACLAAQDGGAGERRPLDCVIIVRSCCVVRITGLAKLCGLQAMCRTENEGVGRRGGS